MSTRQDHAAAFFGLLRADTDLTVYPEDGGTQTVPDGAEPPYVVVHVHVERVDGTRLPGDSDRIVAYATVHSVGANYSAVRTVADRVEARLLDVRPAIAGRSCWPIRQDDSVPPGEDKDTGWVDQVDVYRLESQPG